MTGMIRHLTLGFAGASLIVAAIAAQAPKTAPRPNAAAATPPAAPGKPLDVATGEGLVPAKGDEWTRFEAKHGYAYALGSGTTRQVILLLTSEPAADLAWRTEKFYDVVGDWAEKKQTPYVLVGFDAKGAPELMLQTAGTGVYRTIGTAGNTGLPPVKVSYEVNDGKRLRGRVTAGTGDCGERYCEKRHDYFFDVTVID